MEAMCDVVSYLSLIWTCHQKQQAFIRNEHDISDRAFLDAGCCVYEHGRTCSFADDNKDLFGFVVKQNIEKTSANQFEPRIDVARQAKIVSIKSTIKNAQRGCNRGAREFRPLKGIVQFEGRWNGTNIYITSMALDAIPTKPFWKKFSLKPAHAWYFMRVMELQTSKCRVVDVHMSRTLQKLLTIM